MECCAARKGGGALRVPGIGFALGGGDDDAKVNKDFVTVGRGVGGVDELALSLDESAVQWGLVAQSVGSGAMARTKHVFVYFSGAKCPMVKRMRYTERRPAAVSALGGGGMIDWDREYIADVNLDELLHKVLSAVVADDAGADMSVSSLRAAALDQIKKASEEVKKIAPRKKKNRRSLLSGLGRSLKNLGSSLTGGGGFKPRTALALRADFKLTEALDMVKSQTGALNWVLVTPELGLVEAGGGSIPEMVNFLPESDVAFALVRMGFGAGRFRRNHFLFVHWASDACPVVKRGKANARKMPVKSALHAGEALEHYAGGADDMALKEVIGRMSKVLVIDGETRPGQDVVDPAAGISVAAFEEALKEDNQALAAEFGISETPEAHEEEHEEEEHEEEEALPVSEAVKSVRGTAEPYNWVLIAPRK